MTDADVESMKINILNKFKRDAKSRIDLNMRNLEEVIGKCDFKGTASAFSLATRELIESYKEMEINSEENCL